MKTYKGQTAISGASVVLMWLGMNGPGYVE